MLPRARRTLIMNKKNCVNDINGAKRIRIWMLNTTCERKWKWSDSEYLELDCDLLNKYFIILFSRDEIYIITILINKCIYFDLLTIWLILSQWFIGVSGKNRKISVHTFIRLRLFLWDTFNRYRKKKSKVYVSCTAFLGSLKCQTDTFINSKHNNYNNEYIGMKIL